MQRARCHHQGREKEKKVPDVRTEEKEKDKKGKKRKKRKKKDKKGKKRKKKKNRTMKNSQRTLGVFSYIGASLRGGLPGKGKRKLKAVF